MKKIKISLFLLSFLLLILPVMFVHALDSTVSNYSDLKQIIEDEASVTIALTDDIVVTDDPGLTIKSGKNVILDLNGHTISMESSIDKTSYLILNYGNLTIKDSKGNGKITYSSSSPSENYSYATNTISNQGTLTIESGTIENNTLGGASYGIDNYSNNSLLTINGGKIYSYVTGIRMFVNSQENGNTLVINGGTIEGHWGVQLQVANLVPKAELIVNDVTINAKDIGLYIYDNSTNDTNVNVEINNGKFTAKDEDGAALYIYDTNANVKVNNGTFSGDYAALYFAYNQASSVNNIINGGTFNGFFEIDQKFLTNPEQEYQSNIIIKDGNFSDDVMVWGHDGSDWYEFTNTKFIQGGYFDKIEDEDGEKFYWPNYVISGFEISNESPYHLGHKITLNANYTGSVDEIIYTSLDGSMTKLYDISRDKYKFLGWNTKQDGTGDTITTNSKLTINTTLYAQWELIPGIVETIIDDSDMFDVSIDLDDLYNTVLTDEDEEIINNGSNVKLEIVTKDITNDIPTEDKEIILESIGDKNIGAYIDLSIIKTVNEVSTNIYETKDEIEITINIPEELLKIDDNTTREYYIIRLHDDKVELLDTIYNEEGNTLTFSTDKFSTYAISYQDSTQTSEIETNPKTGDTIFRCMLIFAISILGLSSAIIYSKTYIINKH